MTLVAPSQDLEVAVGGRCAVALRANSEETLHYTADFLDPDGDRQVRVQGRAEPGQQVRFEGAFSQAGWGRVVIRAVNGKGVSGQAEVRILVRP
jgi:hypothetical protein